MALPIKVELNADERAFFESIEWNADLLMKKDYGQRIETLETVKRLTEALFARRAIPQIRVDYFVDPELNIGGRGKSRKEVFERNGTSGEDILRHPHFMPYLWYFIHGPRLPKAAIEGFCRVLDEDRGTSGMVLDQICAFVRNEVRQRGLDYEAPEEFAKLAFEVERSDLAPIVRKHAMDACRR